jgi:hypothetical protein
MLNIDIFMMILILIAVFLLGILAGVWIWDDIINMRGKKCKDQDL